MEVILTYKGQSVVTEKITQNNKKEICGCCWYGAFSVATTFLQMSLILPPANATSQANTKHVNAELLQQTVKCVVEILLLLVFQILVPS